MELGFFVMDSNRFVFRSRCENFRLQEIAITVKATGGVHRTLCGTHFAHAHSLSGGAVLLSIIITLSIEMEIRGFCISSRAVSRSVFCFW